MMMKPEYIVTEIRNLLGIDIGIDVSEYEDCTAVCFYKKDAEVVIAALEKQVPKKPVIAESAPSYVLGKKVYTEYKACGVCGDVVGGGCAEKSNYCSECGNKVDWSEEE